MFSAPGFRSAASGRPCVYRGFWRFEPRAPQVLHRETLPRPGLEARVRHEWCLSLPVGASHRQKEKMNATRFDDGISRYDPGRRLDSARSLSQHTMATPSLNLGRLSHLEALQLTQEIITKMTGNAA